MQVHFYATLRDIVGGKTVEFDLPENSTARELLAEIVAVYPPMARELLNDDGELYQHVHVIINGRDSLFLENKIDTVISPDDKVSIFPAVGGG